MQAYQEKEFNALDRDKNGAIDTNELKSDKTAVLQKADKNNDGKVTSQEASSQFKEYQHSRKRRSLSG